MREADAERDIDRRTPKEIAAALSKRIHGTTLLVGGGQYSPHTGHARVSVLVDKEDNKPTIVLDRFLAESAIAPFCNALRNYAREVFEGEFDTMYATPWSYAWTRAPAPLRVYDRQGLLVVKKNDLICVRRSSGWASIAQNEIARVVGWLSVDWYGREVWIEARNAERVIVAEGNEPMALADPTYDGIDLMCDAAWVGRLGKALAQGIGVPYVPNDRALE